MRYCFDQTNWARDLVYSLHEWQTLIAGLIAILAAWVGARAIKSQTAQAATFSANELQRKHNAERAVLGLALSGIMDATLAAFSSLRNLRSLDNGIRDSRRSFLTKLDLPDDILTRLYGFISTTDDDRLSGITIEICNLIQIRQARQGDENTSDNGIDEACADLLGIVCLVTEIFKYSRDHVMPPERIPWSEAIKHVPLDPAGHDDTGLRRSLELRATFPNIWPR